MSDGFAADLTSAREALASAARHDDLAQRAFATALRTDASERSYDGRAAALDSLLRHGSAIGLRDGSCPLCGAPRTPQEFEAATRTLAEQLKERGKALGDNRCGCRTHSLDGNNGSRCFGDSK